MIDTTINTPTTSVKDTFNNILIENCKKKMHEKNALSNSNWEWNFQDISEDTDIKIDGRARKKNFIKLTSEQESIVVDNMKLAHWFLKENFNTQIFSLKLDYEDVLQEAYLEMCRASQDFDKSLAEPSTYFSHRMFMHLKNYIDEAHLNTNGVKHRRKFRTFVKRAKQIMLEAELEGGKITMCEIINQLKKENKESSVKKPMKSEDWKELREILGRRFISIEITDDNSETENKENGKILHEISEQSIEDFRVEIDKKIFDQHLKNILQEKEYNIIDGYFGFTEKLKKTEILKKYDISEKEFNKKLNSAKKKIKQDAFFGQIKKDKLTA